MADNVSWGEIISKTTADQNFGEATTSQTMSTDLLQSLADQTVNLLMFNIIDDRIIVLGDNRKPLYPDGYTPPPDRIFRVYSKAKVLELIESGGDNNSFVEIRGNIITVTNGDYTLEYGALCPPWCSMT